MKISILTSDAGHPVFPRLQEWAHLMSAKNHAVALLTDRKELASGDILFLVSCGQIVGPHERQKFKATLVLHASDLPQGRGWSPHIWAIVRGATHITVCLLEAADPVDTGRIWLRAGFALEGHELLPEINEKLFDAELALMTQAVEQFSSIAPQPQVGDPGQYLAKRKPEHSQLDPHKTLAEQFDLLRVVDNRRYPAFFDYRGKRYVMRLEKTEK